MEDQKITFWDLHQKIGEHWETAQVLVEVDTASHYFFDVVRGTNSITGYINRCDS